MGSPLATFNEHSIKRNPVTLLNRFDRHVIFCYCCFPMWSNYDITQSSLFCTPSSLFSLRHQRISCFCYCSLALPCCSSRVPFFLCLSSGVKPTDQICTNKWRKPASIIRRTDLPSRPTFKMFSIESALTAAQRGQTLSEEQAKSRRDADCAPGIPPVRFFPWI